MAHPKRDVREAVRRLASIGVEKISYSGGEPLLHPQLEDAIDEAHSHGLDQVLTSNGDVLARKLPPWLGVLQYIKLSFYGNRHVHDSAMGPGHYGTLMAVCGKVAKSGSAVGANYMLSSQSLDCIEEFLDEACESGIRQVLLMTYMPIGRNDINMSFELKSPVETISALTHRLQTKAKRFPGGIKAHNYSNYDFFIVLDEMDRLTLPRNHGEEPFIMGGLFDPLLGLPTGEVMTAPDALECTWRTRLTTDSIVVI